MGFTTGTKNDCIHTPLGSMGTSRKFFGKKTRLRSALLEDLIPFYLYGQIS